MIQVWRSPSTRLLRGLENALDALRGAVEDDVDLARLLDVAQQPLHLLLGVRALLRQLPHRDLHVRLRRRLQELLQPNLFGSAVSRQTFLLLNILLVQNVRIHE